MEDETQVVESKEETQQPIINGTLDETCLSFLKNGKATNRGLLNKNTINLIAGNIEHGISMTTACLYAGVPPTTAQHWFNDGQEEVEKLSDEDILGAEGGIESLISLKGLFYLRTCRARANCVVQIHDMLYERAFESGKEWIATYILERQEPEKYNLKYKVQQEVNANVSANIVEFKFVDGAMARPPEEADFINQQVEELKEKYSKNDIILADARVIEDDEEEEK